MIFLNLVRNANMKITNPLPPPNEKQKTNLKIKNLISISYQFLTNPKIYHLMRERFFCFAIPWRSPFRGVCALPLLCTNHGMPEPKWTNRFPLHIPLEHRNARTNYTIVGSEILAFLFLENPRIQEIKMVKQLMKSIMFRRVFVNTCCIWDV